MPIHFLLPLGPHSVFSPFLHKRFGRFLIVGNPARARRDAVGLNFRISPREKKIILDELERRVAV